MSQKTLLSFFKVQTNEEKNLSKCSNEDSPVKSTTRKKRQRIESSGSEEGNDSDEKASKDLIKKEESPNKSNHSSKLAKFACNKNEIQKEAKNDIVDTSTVKNESVEESSKISETTPVDKLEDSADIKKSSDVKLNGKSSKKSPASKKSKSEAAKKDKKTPKVKLSEKTPKKSPEVNEKENKKSEETSPEKSSPTKSSKEGSSGSISYNPAANKYDPIKDACWKHTEKVPYFALARTLEEIENVSARLKMIEILSNYFRSVIVLSPDDFLHSVYLCLNKVGPSYEGLELGLAEQTLIRAMSQSTGRTFTQIKTEVQETGDLGLVAERSRSSQRLMFQPAPLTVAGIFKKFKEIALMSGQAAVLKKISTIQTLFVACKGPEARFLIRSLNGKLRIGLAEQSVLQAIALACAMTPPNQTYPPETINVSKTMSADSFKSRVEELALVLKTTICECPNYDLIIPVILREGIPALPKHCKITPGLPLKPMLAQPTKGVQEVLTRFEGHEFTCEWKYDGERAQIHYCTDGSVKIYSRNQEDNTSKYPDIISRLTSVKKEGITSFILDCEAVAWDSVSKQIQPFQVLSTRKRKDANKADIKVQVCVFMFDLLYLNGKSLIKEVFFERRRLLHENFIEVEGEWKFATAIDTTKMEEVQEFLEESIKGNCEGLMVKTLTEDATYEIAKRSRNWLKLKKDYLEGVGDTLDLVVLGGYMGKGKRTGTYGGFLVGCYDEDNEEYQSICKIGTGFSDESLATNTEFFKPHIIPKAPAYYQYDTSLEPDHWFQPAQVWETKCADLSLSPIHRAGIGVVDPEKGISLRFPRFLRVRDDKKPEEATTARQIVDMYESQEQVKNQQGSTKFNEEDFY